MDRAGRARAAQDFRGTRTTSMRSNRFLRSTATRGGTRLELGDYDAAGATTSSSCARSATRRVPIETVYADVYLWKNAASGKYSSRW